MSYDHGRFVWYELLTKEIDKAKAFYTEVFNWKIEPQEMAGTMTYQMIKVGDAPIGGFMEPPMEGIPPHWLSYVSVADVDATAKKITDAGGKALAPAMDIPTVGRIQPVQDPQGGVISLFKSEDGDPPAVEGLGTWHWNELWTHDTDASAAFYQGVFGYGNDEMPMPQGTYNIFKISEDKAAGGMLKAPDPNIPTMWLQFVTVDDADAAVERVKSHGGSVKAEPMDVPNVGRFAIIQDPVGAVIGLIKPAPKN